MGASREEDKKPARKSSSSGILSDLSDSQKHWDPSLSMRVPDIFLDYSILAKPREPEAGLRQVFGDCVRLRKSENAVIQFNGERIPDELLPNYIPSLKRVKDALALRKSEVDAKEESIKKSEEAGVPLHYVIDFLEKKLSPQGMNEVLKRFDQGEIGAVSFLLHTEKRNISMSALDYKANYSYSEEGRMTLHVVTNTMAFASTDPQKESRPFVSADVQFGTKLTVFPNGKLERELYTTPKHFPELYRNLLQDHIENMITLLEKNVKDNPLSRQREKLPSYIALNNRLKKDESLFKLFLNNSKDPQLLIEMYVEMESVILPAIQEGLVRQQDAIKKLAQESKGVVDIQQKLGGMEQNINRILSPATLLHKCLTAFNKNNKEDIYKIVINQINSNLNTIAKDISHIGEAVKDLKKQPKAGSVKSPTAKR